MSDRLQWVLDLQDRVSGPGARIERQLGRVRASLKVLDIEARQNKLSAITDPLKRQRAELQLQRDKLMLSKAALDKTGAASRRVGSDTGFFVGKLHDVLHIAQIVGGALERVGVMALGVGKQIGKAINFKQTEMIGLSTFLGGGAGAMFDRLTDFATRTGRSAEEVVGLAKSLSMAGVAAGDIEPILRRLAGLNNISSGSGDTVGRVIANMFTTGKGGAGDIEALRGTPIKVERLYEDLAQKMGGPRNRFVGQKLAEQLSEAGGIGKNLLTSLILTEADSLGASDKAFAGGKTLKGRYDAVLGQIDRMWTRLSRSEGVKAFEKVLDNLRDIFNPDNSKATLQNLEHLSDIIAKALEPLTGADGKKRMQDFFLALSSAVDGVLPGLAAIAGFTGKLAQLGLLSISGFGMLKNLHLGDTELFGPGSESALTKEASERVQRQRRADAQRNGGMSVQITQQIDARGASKEDAEHIANTAAARAKDALTDELVRIATQAGAFTP